MEGVKLGIFLSSFNTIIMKALRFLCGLLSLIAAVWVAAYGINSLITHSGVNPRMIDSVIDKLFYLLLMLGCAGSYGVASFYLFTGTKPFEKRPVAWVGLVSLCAFLFGMYYHVIFGSPL